MPSTPLAYLAATARPYLAQVIAAFILLMTSAAAWMYLPTAIARIVDDVLLADAPGALLTWALVAIVCAAANTGLYLLAYRLMFTAESRARRQTVESLSMQLGRLGPGARNQVSPGDIVSLSTIDVQRSANFIFQIGFTWRSLCMFAIGTALLWQISPVIAVTISAGALLVGTITGPILKRFGGDQRAYQNSLADLTSQASDLVHGLRVLRGIGGEGWFTGRYRRDSARLRSLGYAVAGSDSWMQALNNGLPTILIVATTWLGTRMAAQGELTAGELGAVFMYSVLIAGSTQFVITAAQIYVVARVSADRILSFLRREPASTPDEQTTAGAGDLQDDLAGFTFPAGKLTVVVSERRRPAIALAERLASSPGRLLLHEDHLFTQTLRQTLRVESIQVTDALKAVCGSDIWVSLGADPDARIAGRGTNLSGGQRQRLNLARALAAESDVLVALEPTSAVDAHTESLVASNVAERRRGATTVVFTSSPIWRSHADVVVRLDGGGIVVETYRGDRVSAAENQERR